MTFTTSLMELRIYNIWRVFSTLSIVLFTGIFLLVLKYAYFRRKYNRLLPGIEHRFLDIFGDLSNFRQIYKKGNEYSVHTFIFQTVLDYCRLFIDKQLVCIWLSFVPFVFITKAEAAEALLTGTKYIEKGWIYRWLHSWLGRGLLTSQGFKWKPRRKLLMPTFHTEILDGFLPIFNKHARIFVKRLEKETTENSTDIVTPAALCALDIMCEANFGVCIDVQEKNDCQYVKSVERVSEIIVGRSLNCLHWVDSIFSFTKAAEELNEHIKILHKFSMSIIEERKKKVFGNSAVGTRTKRMALLDLLLKHHINMKDISEEEIREEIDTFAFEGHDTLMVGISWTLYLIGLHKDVQEKLHEEVDRIFGDDTERYATTKDLDDMAYLARVIQESQRLYPPVPYIARQVNENTNICGYPIPKGTSCLIHIYSLHRDARWFPDPEKFDPDRFLPENSKNRHLYAFIPFSAGPRNCIGQRFARMELKIIISTILRNYTLHSLDQRDKVPPSYEIILKSKIPVRIKFRPRKTVLSQLQ